MKKNAILLSSILSLGGITLAVNFGEKPNTPLLPGGKYVVHDGTRPQPDKVQTAGAVSVKPPGDAKILFDGTDLNAWTDAGWLLKDGLMIAKNKDIATRESFRDVQLHIEWRVPAGRKLDGQAGGNSGVFFMGQYEVQILQSLENKTYPDGQAGAMYGQYPPLVNASAAQGEWQSYDIIFIAPIYDGEKCTTPAKVTVLHNGVLLHNAKEYLGPSVHKRLSSYPKTHPEKAPIRLQWHGDPIEFRNIWIRNLKDYDQH